MIDHLPCLAELNKNGVSVRQLSVLFTVDEDRLRRALRRRGYRVRATLADDTVPSEIVDHVLRKHGLRFRDLPIAVDPRAKGPRIRDDEKRTKRERVQRACVSLSDAAEQLGRSRQVVRRLGKAGRLVIRRVGSRVFVTLPSLENLLRDDDPPGGRGTPP